VLTDLFEITKPLCELSAVLTQEEEIHLLFESEASKEAWSVVGSVATGWGWCIQDHHGSFIVLQVPISLIKEY
jgi:hypothetical protein